MRPPPVQYNTYVQSNETPYIDTISKVYLICEFMLGLNRLPVFGNVRFILILLTLAYSASVQMLILYMLINVDDIISYAILAATNLAQFGFTIVFSFISWKRVQLYYCELNKFDMKVGCRPYTPKGSIKNFILLIVILVLLLLLYILPYVVDTSPVPLSPMLVILCLDIIEVYYFGHLLNLLTPRLRLINYFMELSLSNVKETTALNIKEFKIFNTNIRLKSNCEMKKLMDLYHTVIKAYDFLIEAIKWQLLFIIIASFITVLGLCYRCSFNVIRNRSPWQIFLADFGLSLLIELSLFSPCIFGDRVHSEVRRLRELLASRLYENKLDKSCRSIARALLAFTETRDLSFSLLRMVSIDISMPFKFVGLLVTYVIILLQFEKVINP